MHKPIAIANNAVADIKRAIVIEVFGIRGREADGVLVFTVIDSLVLIVAV